MPEADPLPPPASHPAAIAPKSVIETDTFCDSCGFNLFTQPVWRDDRLQILLCRCPECGRHQPAQNKTTVGNIWLQRLGTFGLILWVGLVLAVVTALFFGMMGMHAVAEEMLTFEQIETADGRMVQQSWNATGTGGYTYTLVADGTKAIAANQVRDVRHLADWLPGGTAQGPAGVGLFRSSPSRPLQAAVALGLFTFAIFTLSCFLVAASWFWRRRRRWAWLGLPLLSFFTIAMLARQPTRVAITGWPQSAPNGVEFTVYIGVLALQLFIFSAAILTGLTLARVALLMFVPPRARQSIAFLWLCEGKTPPSPKL
jgi:hypothetical protein